MEAVKKKKILIFSTAYLPLVGGAEVAVNNLTERIDDFEFDLITARIRPELPKHERIGQIDVYRVGWGNNFDKLLLPFLGVIKALILNRRNNYPIVWSIMASYGGFAGLFYKTLKPRVRFLLTLQEGDDFSYIRKRVGPFYFLFKRIFRRADHIQAISRYLAQWAKDMGAIGPIEVLPNGVDLAVFQPAWLEENLAKRIIVTVSRLVEKNGVRDLLSAMPLIDGELWIIGDGMLKGELEKHAIDLKVSERVKFLGNLSPSAVAEKLAQASVFIRPSLSEGLGNAFLEAMAIGLPTIGTPVGGIPDFLINAETGWLCEAGNPSSIVEKINYILDQNNSGSVKKVTAKAKTLVADNYDWDKLAKKMQTLLNELNLPKKPKLLIATGIYRPDIGGPATIIGELKQSLADNGYAVKVITYSEASSQDTDASVVRVKKNKFYSKPIYFVRLFWLSLSADLIYATDTYSVGYFVYLLKRFCRKPYILRFAGDSAWETAFATGLTTDYITAFQANKQSGKIERLKARRAKILCSADKVIAVSGFMSQVAQAIGVKAEKIQIIYNSVDFEHYQELDRQEFFRQYGLSVDDKLIMTACRLTPWKGVDTLIRALDDLRQTMPVKLMILGDGSEKEKLQILVQELGVEKQVIFAGIISQAEMIGYLGCADVFVLNTYYEGLSHTLLEAIKAGTPIIATSVGGNPEVIQSGVNGLLVEYNNELQIKEAIKLILNDQNLAERFTTEALKQSAKFSWAKVIKQTIETINKIDEKSLAD